MWCKMNLQFALRRLFALDDAKCNQIKTESPANVGASTRASSCAKYAKIEQRVRSFFGGVDGVFEID